MTGFIKATAKDYDMSVEEVQTIFDNHPHEKFYEELEKFIADRAKQNEEPDRNLCGLVVSNVTDQFTILGVWLKRGSRQTFEEFASELYSLNYAIDYHNYATIGFKTLSELNKYIITHLKN